MVYGVYSLISSLIPLPAQYGLPHRYIILYNLCVLFCITLFLYLLSYLNY